MSFIAVDFEASCLPQFGPSFPIEVGLARAIGWSQSWLIRPHARWRDWHWNAEAEALHGISHEQLQDEGLEVGHVADLLRDAAGTMPLIADSTLDDDWSRTLFDAAGEATHVPIGCISAWPEFHLIDPTRLAEAIALADAERACRHRAQDDARWLARLLHELGFDGEQFAAKVEKRMPAPIAELVASR